MSEFLKLAYRKLNLPMEGHNIGTMRYIDLHENVLYTICARHLNLVNERLHGETEGALLQDGRRSPYKLAPDKTPE